MGPRAVRLTHFLPSPLSALARLAVTPNRPDERFLSLSGISPHPATNWSRPMGVAGASLPQGAALHRLQAQNTSAIASSTLRSTERMPIPQAPGTPTGKLKHCTPLTPHPAILMFYLDGSIPFYGAPFSITNIFNFATKQFDTPGRVYPDSQKLFYLPSPFTTWQVGEQD